MATNLFNGNWSATATKSGVTTSGTSYSLNTSLMPYASMAGKVFRFYYEYSVEGERKNNTGDYSKDRFGLHLSYNCAAGVRWLCASYLEARGTGLAIQHFEVPSSEVPSIFSVAQQSFNQPAASNDATWYLRNATLETGVKLSFDKQGGSGGDVFICARPGEALDSVQIPKKSGCLFVGYYNDSNVQYYNSKGAPIKTCDYSTPFTLYAKWISNKENIRIEDNPWLFKISGDTTVTANFKKLYGKKFMIGK